MPHILLTGAAGFIGFHVASLLLRGGAHVVGVDNLNSYYTPALKRGRLDQLKAYSNFEFIEADIADHDALRGRLALEQIESIVHLAAQAGVRYSLDHPFEYERSNIAGHLSILELARHASALKHLVYASSSSVYGDRTEGPFREDDRCDTPVSLYAATKKACELMSETYSRLYQIPQTGLRFFTVYGPWGRPDMAYWSFTEKIRAGKPITLFAEGKLSRDFTYVDDVAAAVVNLLSKPPAQSPPHRIYNIGNSRPTSVLQLVSAIELAAGKKAEILMAPMQKGDVHVTFADVSRAAADFGYAPTTNIEEGIARFVSWYDDRGRQYRANA